MMQAHTQNRFDEKAWALAAKIISGFSSELTNPGHVYVLSNEIWTPEVYATLNATRATPNAGHIGVSALQNFDIAATRCSNYMIFINHNPTMFKVVDLALELFKRSSISRQKYCAILCDKILNEIPADAPFTARDDLKVKLQAELTRAGSFLSNDRSFEHVARLVKEGHVINLQLDLRDPRSFNQMLGVLYSSGLRLDSFYLSNVRMHVEIVSGEPKDIIALATSICGIERTFPDAILVESNNNNFKPLTVQPPMTVKEAIRLNPRWVLKSK